VSSSTESDAVPVPEIGPRGGEEGVESVPEAFLERLSRILSPPDFEAAARSFSTAKRTAFRANLLVGDEESILSELRSEGIDSRPVPGVPGAMFVETDQRPPLLESRTCSARRIYIQNPSSMIPPLVLGPTRGEEVLDLAAAPGSKTHQMACMMNNEGRITAVESVRSRYYKLRENMQSLGAENVRPFFQDGTVTWRHRPEYFDRVLLDAPCSSEGRFRADEPETTRYWSAKKIRDMSRKQRRLLFSAIHCLKPGGRLVYSTCSFSPEENEVVIQRFLNKFSDSLRVLPIDMEHPGARGGLREWEGRQFSVDMQHARRVVPDDLMDGFFVCLLEKTASTLR
jgi:16S rRNA (cytosine1407-C5)-methyltransferase